MRRKAPQNRVIQTLRKKFPPKRPEESVIKKLRKRYRISDLEKQQMFDDDDPFDFFVKDLDSMKEDLADLANDVADIFADSADSTSPHSAPSEKRPRKKPLKPVRVIHPVSVERKVSNPEPAVAQPPHLETPSYRGGLAEEYMKLKQENERLKAEIIKTVQKEFSEDLEKFSSGSNSSTSLATVPKMNFLQRFWTWFKGWF